MRTADYSTGGGEHGALPQTSPARAIFLRSNGEWMEYEGGSGEGSRACAEENQSFGETSTYTIADSPGLQHKLHTLEIL